ncbi:enoyl-CoA hydratase/isomerase family protein [Candidatus Obscuribacterales bacterium]|nr:enoyl-CoA hydratase/isomerase family protein [Candidatus Obscuribacterales bacterium]
MAQSTQEHAMLTGISPELFNFKRIVYSKKNYIATIAINRPDVLNCFDQLTLLELSNAFLDASRDDAIAVVVVTGVGDKAFCTGADLKEQRRSDSQETK